MGSAGTAELEYPVIHVESADQISSRIQPRLLRRTATIRVIITRLRGTLKPNRVLDGIFQLTRSTRSKGWPKSHEIWSRRAVHATDTTMATATTSASTTHHPITATVTATAATTSVQQQRLQRATDPEVMGENIFNRTRRSRPQVSLASTVATSPKSTSSNSVQIAQPPPPTVIDLTVENIEDLMMADVQEQKAASYSPKDKAAKGKRKHVANGSPIGRPPQDTN
jgi:hypothetical protein